MRHLCDFLQNVPVACDESHSIRSGGPQQKNIECNEEQAVNGIYMTLLIYFDSI